METQRDRELKMFHSITEGCDGWCTIASHATELQKSIQELKKLQKILEEDPLDAFFRTNPKETIRPDPEDYDNDKVRKVVEEIGNGVKFLDDEDEMRYASKHC